MTPKQKTYHNQFVFSLAPILPDLESDVRRLQKELAGQGHSFSHDDLVATWVMYQLERHLHLTLEFSDQRAMAQRLAWAVDEPFFHNHAVPRDLLISQILPLLTHRETVPYTDRICRVSTRLPDLHIRFL